MANTNQSLSQLQEFYNSNKQKIIDAYNCCVNNPCSKAIEQVESLIQEINSEMQKIGVWDDSMSELLKEGMIKYSKKLEDFDIKLSEFWLVAESLYKRNYDLLNELEKYIKTLSSSSDRVIVPKSQSIVSEIEKNLNQLKVIGGAVVTTEVGLLSSASVIAPTVVETPTQSSSLLETYNGVNIMTASESEALAWLNKHKKSGNIKVNSVGYTVRYSQGANRPWMNWTSPDGKVTTEPSCVIISFATALTSTLSQYSGHQVIVNPTQVMDGLYAYCQKHNIKFSKFVQSDGSYSGDYKLIPTALEEIWGVKVSGFKNAISIANAQSQLQSGNNASIVYRTHNSSGGVSHAAAATGVTGNGNFVVSDTYYSREKWINGTTNFDSVDGYNFIITKS